MCVCVYVYGANDGPLLGCFQTTPTAHVAEDLSDDDAALFSLTLQANYVTYCFCCSCCCYFIQMFGYVFNNGPHRL